MIDVNKCEYEESVYDTDCECVVHYFTYPKDLGECEFYAEEDYGSVFCMCISLTMYENGECHIAMSPTVEEEDSLFDVDWRDLHEGINYTSEMIPELLRRAKG